MLVVLQWLRGFGVVWLIASLGLSCIWLMLCDLFVCGIVGALVGVI